MQSMDIHSEQFEEILAEALRAGPGSPAWRQAVDALHEAGEEGNDYALLCRAREDLASGREYRKIAAGPGFTQKLMTSIDREQSKQWNLPTANIVAIIAVAVVTLTVVIGAWLLFSPAKTIHTDAELLETYFVTPTLSEDFRTDTPAGLIRIGLLPLKTGDGAKVEVQTRQTDKHVGGGFVTREPVPAGDVIAVESVIEVDRPDTDLIAELFVSDRPDFDSDTGISPHELVCLLEQGNLRVVMPEGKTAGETKLDAKTVTLRIRLNRDSAVVEQNGTKLWSGTHHLAPVRDRYVGVRLLAPGGQKSTGVTIRSLKLLKP